MTEPTKEQIDLLAELAEEHDTLMVEEQTALRVTLDACEEAQSLRAALAAAQPEAGEALSGNCAVCGHDSGAHRERDPSCQRAGCGCRNFVRMVTRPKAIKPHAFEWAPADQQESHCCRCGRGIEEHGAQPEEKK